MATLVLHGTEADGFDITVDPNSGKQYICLDDVDVILSKIGHDTILIKGPFLMPNISEIEEF